MKGIRLFILNLAIIGLCSFNLKAQTDGTSLNVLLMVNTIQNGDNLNWDDLGKIQNLPDWRILRNAIYARHGYRFKSKDLQQYFKRFDWYAPELDSVEHLFTEIDNSNLQAITHYEIQLRIDQEMHKPLESGEHELTKEEQAFIGIWHIIPMMPSAWAENFVFFENRRMMLRENQMDCSKRLILKIGTWEIAGGQLVITFSEEEILKGGHMEIASGSCGSDSSLEDALAVFQKISPPETVTFKLSGIVEGTEEENRLPKILIGETAYWKMYTDPFEYD